MQLLFCLCLLTLCVYPRSSLCDQHPPQCSESSNGSLACSEMYGDACPPGLFCKDGHCECVVYPDYILRCNGTSSMILGSYCATFDEERNITLLGLCLHQITSSPVHNYMYHHLESDTNLLTNFTCQELNRTGALCGKCLPDHYPLAYSYSVRCIPCPHVRWNWVRYTMAAYLPLTLFYLTILFFKVNTTSSNLFALVYYCQTLSMPALIRNMLLGKYRENSPALTMIKAYSSIYGIWNLDFFRPFYSDICLGIGILPTLALDYAIAVYPLLLMIISYLLIVLYDRNYRVVTIMWRPFRVLFSLFRRNWDVRTSVVDAFATFFFLSNIKFLSISFDLLAPTRVYHLYGDTYNYTLGLYYAGDIEYFGSEHLPYAILAIAVLCVFVILPIALLALYPFSFFQKFLNLFPVRWYVLHTFVDSFQGCYKNGTKPGTRDYRWFASAFFIIRCSYFMLYFWTAINLYSSLVAVILILQTSLVAIFQPFKSSQNHHNTINYIFLQLLTLFAVLQSADRFATMLEADLVYLVLVLRVFCLAVPVFYVTACTAYWMYTHRRFGLDLINRLRARITGYALIVEPVLPDRIENSGKYPRENLANFTANN